MENLNRNIIISNMMFEITFDPPALTEIGNPENTLIIDKGHVSKGHFILHIDNVKHISQVDKDSSYLSPFRVPEEIFQPDYIDSPEKVRHINLKSEKNSLGFIMPDQDLRDRLAGKLPIWYIGKDAFIYDVLQEQLIPVDGKTPPIALSKFQEIDDDYVDVRGAFYDAATRQIDDPELQQDESKDNHVSFIMILGPLEVDPVGVARKEGKPDSAYLNLKEGRCLREYRTLLNHPPNAMGMVPTICEINKSPKQKREKKRGKTLS